MKRFLKALFLLGLLISVFVFGATGETAWACSNDMKTTVSGGWACWAIHVINDGGIEPGRPLVVFLHGDAEPVGKSGRYRKSIRRMLRKLKRKNMNTILIARPGCERELPTGLITTGIDVSCRGNNYTPVVLDGLAAALKALKAHYKPSKLILLGHSGGAMLSGILLGRNLGLAEGAVLVGWGCDTEEWREWRNLSAGKRGTWDESLSARDYVDKVPVKTKIVALTGSRDENTLPKFGKMCTDELIARGVAARFEVLEGWGHGSALRSDDVTEAVLEVSR